MEYDHEYLAAFVRRAQNGDSDAFAQLYTFTFNKVYNYCRHYLRDDYLAQDALQDVYILALKNIKNIKDPTLFVAWIDQIAFHTCYDICKKNRNDYGDIDQDMLEEICDTSLSASPEGQALQNDERARLAAAIDRLNPMLKHLITLRYINNMKIDDIVSMTDLSKSTVKRHLQTAIEQLQKFMKE